MGCECVLSSPYLRLLGRGEHFSEMLAVTVVQNQGGAIVSSSVRRNAASCFRGTMFHVRWFGDEMTTLLSMHWELRRHGKWLALSVSPSLRFFSASAENAKLCLFVNTVSGNYQENSQTEVGVQGSCGCSMLLLCMMDRGVHN